MELSDNQQHVLVGTIVTATETMCAVFLANCGQPGSTLSCSDANILIGVISGLNAILLAVYGFKYKKKKTEIV